MIFLNPTESIVANLTSTPSTNPVFIVNYGVIDKTTGTFREAVNSQGSFSGTSEISILAAPDDVVNKRFDVKNIQVYNLDTSTITINIFLKKVSTNYKLITISLSQNWSFQYAEGRWFVYNDLGLVMSSSFLRVSDLPDIPQSKIINLVSDLAGKQDTLISGSNIKTISGQSILGAGNLYPPIKTYSVGIAETQASTTSATDILLDRMIITNPEAGTYLVIAYTTSTNSNNTTNYFSIYSGGVQVPNTLQEANRTNNALVNFRIPYMAMAQVTVNGSQSIEIRWSRQANTATCYSRYLTAMRIQ